jgi:hypothetical protein
LICIASNRKRLLRFCLRRRKNMETSLSSNKIRQEAKESTDSSDSVSDNESRPTQ